MESGKGRQGGDAKVGGLVRLKKLKTGWQQPCDVPDTRRWVLIILRDQFRHKDRETGEPSIEIHVGYFVPSLREWRLSGSPSDWTDTVECWHEFPQPPEGI
jgi:hypothetical protein